MGIGGPRVELIGVSVTGFGPVRRQLHFGFRDAVVALYGKNGAGKTSLLMGLECACSGVAGPPGSYADLHIRIDLDEYPEDPFVRNLTVFSMRQSLNEIRGDLLEEADEDLSNFDTDNRGTGVIRAADPFDEYVDCFCRLYEVAREIRLGLDDGLAAGTLTLRATGSPSKPEWAVYLSFPPDRGDTDVLDRVRELSEEVAAYITHEIFDAHEAKVPTLVAGLISGFGWGVARDGLTPYVSPAGGVNSKRRASHGEWPPWLPLPMIEIARIDLGPVAILGHEASMDSLNSRTRDEVIHSGGSGAVISGFGAGTVRIDELSQLRLDSVIAKANAAYSDFLLDAPMLTFSMKSPDEWLLGSLPEWQVVEARVARGHPIDSLSSAQQRWARIAIGLALSAVRHDPIVFVSDEPERGLHPVAARHMVSGLVKQRSVVGGMVVAASHSLAVLESRDVEPILVTRGAAGHTSTDEVAIDIVDGLAAEASAMRLGMGRADILTLLQRVVAVEGIHDQWVLSNLLRAELSRAGQMILPMHGAKRARSLAEQNYLLLTNARFLVIMDNLDNSRAESLLHKVQELVAVDDLAAADQVVAEFGGVSKGEEGDYLSSLIRAAIHHGALDRIELFGLSLPDVICYLREDSILLQPGYEWAALIGEWEREALRANKPPSNIKGWLRKRRLLPQDNAELDSRIRRACLDAGESSIVLHEDLRRLAQVIARSRL